MATGASSGSTSVVRVLVADEVLTFPARDGGSRALFDLIRTLDELGARIDVVRTPDEVRRLIEDGAQWSTAFLSRPELTLRCAALVGPAADRVVYVGHDLHHRRLAPAGATPGAGLGLSRAYEAMERQCWQRVDISVYPDPDEAAAAAALVGARRARWFPYYRVDEVAEPVPRPDGGFLFVGGAGHAPNVAAVRWFAESVQPLAHDLPPLDVVGRWPREARTGFDPERIRFLGVVGDEQLTELLATCGAVVVPLRVGAGVKSKVIDALAAAAPLVTTSIGLQGITSTQPIAWLADAAADWPHRLRVVAAGGEEVMARARRGARLVEERYGTSGYHSALRHLVPDLYSHE